MTFKAATMLVSPLQAKAWLTLNTKNRTVRPVVVERLKSDLIAGRWCKGAAVIVLDDENVLVNGQHTLLAIVGANLAAWCVVVFGADKEARLVVDSHSPRKRADSLLLAGHGAILEGFSARKNTASAAYEIARLGGSRSHGFAARSTNSELAAFAESHYAAGEWTLRTFNRFRVSRVTTGPVIGAFMRAAEFYPDQLDTLQQAVEVLCLGRREDPQDHERRDATLVTLRNSLVQSSATNGGSSMREVAYRKTERAIQAFMAGEALTKIYDPRRELFPYPDEREDG